MGAPSSHAVEPGAPPPQARISARRPLARGVAAAVVATAVAMVSHVLGGGAVPRPAGVAVPLLLAMSTCLVLAQVRLPWLRLTASVALSQALFHLLFSVGTPGAGAPTGSGGHLHGPPPALPSGLETTAHVGHASGQMWLAHGGAVVVTVLVLRRGEVVLARLRDVLAREARRIVPPPLPALPVRPHIPPSPLHDDRAWAPVARVLTSSCVVRRGPPVRTPASV